MGRYSSTETKAWEGKGLTTAQKVLVLAALDDHLRSLGERYLEPRFRSERAKLEEQMSRAELAWQLMMEA